MITIKQFLVNSFYLSLVLYIQVSILIHINLIKRSFRRKRLSTRHILYLILLPNKFYYSLDAAVNRLFMDTMIWLQLKEILYQILLFVIMHKYNSSIPLFKSHKPIQFDFLYKLQSQKQLL